MGISTEAVLICDIFGEAVSMESASARGIGIGVRVSNTGS